MGWGELVVGMGGMESLQNATKNTNSCGCTRGINTDRFYTLRTRTPNHIARF